MTTGILRALTLVFAATGASSPDRASTQRTITGRVVDGAGIGVARLRVQAIHDDAQHTGRALGSTLGDGSFVLYTTGEEPVNIVVGSGKAGFAFKAAVAPASANLSLQLRPGGIVRLRAHGADGGPRARLSVQGPVGIDGGYYLELHGAWTNADGVALLAVPVGRIDVAVRSGEGRQLAIAGVNVAVGEVSDVDVLIP
jgi:hypothetical protein